MNIRQISLNTVIVIIILYPLYLIVIPSILGYYLYGFLNNEILIYAILLGCLIFFKTSDWSKKYKKQAKIYLYSVVVIGSLYAILGIDYGSNMTLVEGEVPINTTGSNVWTGEYYCGDERIWSSHVGGWQIFSTKTRLYRDTFISFYKTTHGVEDVLLSEVCFEE